MHLYTLAVSPVPPPPDFWGEVNRLAGWLLPTATAWVVSVAISLWLWFKFLRDQVRRARGAGQAAIGFLDKAQGTRAAALVSAAVGILQLTWLFLTWIFAMMVTWILHLERQVDTLQWNGWTATYLLACACVLGSSYAVAFGLAGRGYRNARSRYDREYLIYYRLCWVPVALPAVIAALGAVFLLIGGLAALVMGDARFQQHLEIAGTVALVLAGYIAASWGAVAAPLLIERAWRRTVLTAAEPATR